MVNDLFLRAAALYEHAARLLRNVPEMRSFILQQSAAWRQASANSLDDLDALVRTGEAILTASEHYLDDLEATRRPADIIRLEDGGSP